MTGSAKSCLWAGAVLIAACGARAGQLYDNGSFIQTGSEASSGIQADDFELAEQSSITGGTVTIFEFAPGDWDGTLRYYLYADNSGAPGSMVASGDASIGSTSLVGTHPFGWEFTAVEFSLEAPVVLDGSTRFWFGVVLNDDMQDGEVVNWASVDTRKFNASRRSNQGTGAWTTNSRDFSFELTGEPIPAPGALAALGLGGLAAARRRRR